MHYSLPTVFSTSRFATLPLGDRTRFFVDTTTQSYIGIRSARDIPILNTMARICSDVKTHFLLNSRIRWKSHHSARSTRALVNFVKDILLFTRPAHRIRFSGGRAALALVSGPIRGIRTRFNGFFPFQGQYAHFVATTFGAVLYRFARLPFQGAAGRRVAGTGQRNPVAR